MAHPEKAKSTPYFVKYIWEVPSTFLNASSCWYFFSVAAVGDETRTTRLDKPMRSLLGKGNKETGRWNRDGRKRRRV